MGIEPAICRTLELPRTINLAELHEVLQAAFGWNDSHLHQFDIGGITYGAPEYDGGYDDERKTFEATEVHLSDFTFRFDRPVELRYEYDFGDNWVHHICLSLAPRQDGVRYPRCAAGARSAPPEDSGGPYSYSDLLDAWRDPDHDEHAATRRWTGRKFDPEHFDLIATNKAIATAMRRAKGNYRQRLVAQ